jgi:hypothetical protein
MARGRKKGSSKGCQVVGHLMDDEFNVVVEKEGWENIAGYLLCVCFPELTGGGSLQLTFKESKNLDVVTFFVDWVVKKEAHDVIIWLGSGKKGLLFSGCSVGEMYMDDLSKYEKEECGLRREVRLAVELKYVAVFIVDKTKAERCAIG